MDGKGDKKGGEGKGIWTKRGGDGRCLANRVSTPSVSGEGCKSGLEQRFVGGRIWAGGELAS